ncbi:hypothetical protein AU210_016270 [Fusarium oxysporum f. sp. radicis-cucumerinum]|nr:hypothetical protein AU210_016270 [Fusarium oxysporum f. sp. radicis-cucumerinum]
MSEKNSTKTYRKKALESLEVPKGRNVLGLKSSSQRAATTRSRVMRTFGDYSPSRAAGLESSTGTLDLSVVPILIGKTILDTLNSQVVSLDSAEVFTRNQRKVSES